MMKRRGFFLNSTVILLLIPILLLLATYEDVSSQIIQAQGVRIQAERTYRIISYLELDFQKALEISGKRAVIAVVDYVSVTGNFISPAYMVNNTIRDLILEGNSPSLAGYDPNRVMRGQSLRNWFTNITENLNKQGFRVSPTVDDILDDTNITVAPLDSFRIVIRARIPNVTIRDASGRVVYTGPIPSNGGYVYSIVDLQNLEDPLFSAMTGGRYYRSIKACKYAFPEILEGPIKVLYGNGSSDTSHVVGRFSTTIDSQKIFFGDTYPGDGAMAYVVFKDPGVSVDFPIILNTTLNGIATSPTQIFKENDMGVLVFGTADGSYNWGVARAYDLQPFIDCIENQSYFGIENGWSFFERLEGGSDNHDRYVELAREMQDELGLESYPIGLVSFMIPYFSYDEKLFNLFNALGIPVEEGQSSVDYYFLNYYFKNRPKTTGFRVWGVSYGIIPEGDLSSIPFFIDDSTAEAIFGSQGSQDLLKR